ncbi:MAG: hypothetical protein M0R39_09475 [Prolixibacteraceae bacterium]|nr:hypothetical protein [Prolixibacteraceae bacterium]
MCENSYTSFTNLFRIIVFTILISVLFFYPSRSQTNTICAHASLAEKIYLQLDGKVYTTDQTIWFKSIVTNAVDHAPTILSGVLYVELIGPDEKIVEKKLIKLGQGIGDGFFELHKSYAEGVYLVRAYTEWNKNFGSDFIFKEYIELFSPSSKKKPDPISRVTLVETQNKERRLNASFDPFVLDSLHKRELTLFITLDGKKDSLSVKKNGDNKYMIDYPIPDKCQFVTLQMMTKNQFSYSKTIALDQDYLDLQFFPESGELVHGLPGKVGFKALDCNGKGKMIEGEIVNRQDEVVTFFKGNPLGMGSFILSKADSNTTYFARLKSESEKNLSVMYPLPKVARSGNVLSVIKYKGEIRLTVSSSYLQNDSIFIRASCRGMVYHDIKGVLKQGTRLFSLPANQLPEGIIAFTLMDPSRQPVAERLFFNERAESRLNIAISADRDTCAQRELTRLNIATTNNQGEAVNASLSLLVFNKAQLGQLQSRRQNILSYFLLGSDLKGGIEDPGFYFRKGRDSYNDLDALLLTQGWRKYLYTKPVGKILFWPEAKLSVTGTVSGIFSKKKRGAELSLLTFGKNRSVHTQHTDSLGRFNFNINDEYGQNLNILIQSADKTGKQMNYPITLDKKVSPPISFNYVMSIGKADSVVHALVEKNMERKKVDDTFQLSAGDILLGEVVVEAYRMTPERQKVMDTYGKPDQVIEGKAIQEKEAKWSYGLYSVLLFNFPDIIIYRGGDGNLYAKVQSFEMTLVVIDGIPVKYYAYPLIPNIPPSEVKSFEIIKNAKNFFQLYLETYPQASPLTAPFQGDVIAIYTYGGQGIYGANQPVGIVKAAVPVFSATREFYAPKYENLQETDWYKPDLRALVHWEPRLKVDSLGKTSASFYNADNVGEMEVVVEAISDKGEIGYKEMVYCVKKRK